MKTTINITGYIQVGNVNGIVLERNNGDLIVGTYSPFTLAKSTNKGRTWSTKHTDATSGRNARLNFIDSRGYIFFGNSVTGTPGTVLRSTDGGESFQTVLTVDSSSVWYMAEDASGNLYVSEYSAGLGDANELYAYNIWRSTNQGASFSKWYTNPGQSAPGAKDGVRHIHGFFIDSAGRKYISFGDTGAGAYVGENVGKTYRMNDNATLGDQMSVGTDGNGWVSFIEAANGGLLFGGDKAPMSVYKYNPANNTYTVALDIFTYFGSPWNSPVYSLCKGRDGVLYFKNNEENSKLGGVFASPDDGVTWYLLDISGNWLNGTAITCNPNGTSGRVYVSRSNNPYISIPDFTRQQLNSLVSPGYGRRRIGWYS